MLFNIFIAKIQAPLTLFSCTSNWKNSFWTMEKNRLFPHLEKTTRLGEVSELGFCGLLYFEFRDSWMFHFKNFDRSRSLVDKTIIFASHGFHYNFRAWTIFLTKTIFSLTSSQNSFKLPNLQRCWNFTEKAQ